MKTNPATPSKASAIILLNHERECVLWARRNPKLRFLGGFHGFTGGKLDKNDNVTEVRNCKDPEVAAHIACAVRETFEETGVLLVRNGDKLTKGQRVSLHDDLVSGRSSFTEILDTWGLWIDARDFYYAGMWTTPEFSPIRFATKFFVSVCPRKQIPYDATEELLNVEFVKPEAAIDLWEKSRVLMVPPVLSGLRGAMRSLDENQLADGLREFSQKNADSTFHLELSPRIICLPLRTKTLPPATHTNCFIVGRKRFVVIDPASTEDRELEKLFVLVDGLINMGGKCEAIIVSHLHKDHYGGEKKLKRFLSSRHKMEVPIAAHPITAKSLGNKVTIDETVEGDQSYTLTDSDNNCFDLDLLHTPGHARGHLCFYDKELGFLLSSDNVVGQGTVVIAPPEGNMKEYLESLKRMRDLPGLNFLCGSHGSAIAKGRERIQEYIDHRLDREQQILQLVKTNPAVIEDIVREVYPDLDDILIPLAIKTVEAHLDKLRNEGKIGNYPGLP